ncbi:MAG: hypothetical protein IT435_14600 [Phycisphaerales bacterium]|nr:hypothetical protein [Phycisphaerales bacterium]
MTADRRPLYYTFGNHMHWVDMQWLWGYDVLPGSVDDMLRLIEETGARGNVNFDAVGYEKMASECPEHLAKLKAAIAEGKVEPVGCSYGQPYGLFHGGESNIRQLTYGVRATRRLLGVRPRAFWEEEFYFFPQLPQMLAQCGYTGACLFFQWTWHTPEIPKEPCSLILWEGIDGTRLPTLPRNELNVHQWPEEFDGLLEKVVGAEGTGDWALGTGGKPGASASLPSTSAQCPMPSDFSSAFPPAIVQWLELMPSKDWMCRSEVLLPRLKELMGDPRFEVRARTVSGVIEELLANPDRQGGGIRRDIPIRRYSMDEVWHGMTLGKNADAHPRTSRETEEAILHAETISAMASLLGRPYASWDVYPGWELDEAWRELLAGQHHDNHECEGLCGFVGHHQMERARMSAAEVSGRSLALLSSRLFFGEPAIPWTNPLGWSVTIGDVLYPPFGYALPRGDADSHSRAIRDGDRVRFDLPTGIAEFDLRRAQLTFVGDPSSAAHIVGLRLRMDGRASDRLEMTLIEDEDGHPEVMMTHTFGERAVHIRMFPGSHGLEVAVDFRKEQGEMPIRPGPGFDYALQLEFVRSGDQHLRSDFGYSAEPAEPWLQVRRKYPHGDWMTSPQWFEAVHRPLTSRSWIDVEGIDSSGVLIMHDGSQQWFEGGETLRVVLTAYDPWDEQRYGVPGYGAARFALIPHKPAIDSELTRLAQEADEYKSLLTTTGARPVGGGTPTYDDRVPEVFGPLEVCAVRGVLAHAFFRESMKSGEHLPAWAGHRMFKESGGACTHPFVIRLVEWNGEPAAVVLKLAGPVALAAKTNLLGEVLNDGKPCDRGVGGMETRDPGEQPSPTPPSGRGLEGGWSPLDTGWLTVEPADPPEWAIVNGKPIELRGKPIQWSQVRFTMRPREIATIYADMVMGRKEFRDLDAKREVWATIHKQEST